MTAMMRGKHAWAANRFDVIQAEKDGLLMKMTQAPTPAARKLVDIEFWAGVAVNHSVFGLLRTGIHNQ